MNYSNTSTTQLNIDWSNPEFVRDVFERSDEHLHLSPQDRINALAHAPELTIEDLIEVLANDSIDEEYKTALLNLSRESSGSPLLTGIRRNLDTVGHLKYGYTPRHTIQINLKGSKFDVELPEVEVWKNNSSYVTRMQNCDKKDLAKTLYKCALYTKRYAMDTGSLVQIAHDRGLDFNRALRTSHAAGQKAYLVKTIDAEAKVFFENAVEHCNSFKQVQILIALYTEACTYTTMQPVFCKKRCSDSLGVDRKVIIRLFARLEKIGLLMESPETMKKYDYAAGMPLSNPRIVNMDLTQHGRWWNLDEKPGPDRSPEKKALKQRRTEVLAGNGYWKESK